MNKSVAVKNDGTVYKINVMRSVIPSMLSVVKLSVVMLNVMAPFEHLLKNNKEQERGKNAVLRVARAQKFVYV